MKKDIRNISRSSLMSKLESTEVEPRYDYDKMGENRKLLHDCRMMWDNMSAFRINRQRCMDYNFGRQWEDYIPDPDSHFGTKIKEADYIRRQHKIPLKNNLIRKITKATLGVYESNDNMPIAVTRTREEQPLGDMMSIALQYAYQTNNIQRKNSEMLLEAMISGIAVRGVTYKWNDERQIFDVYVKNENPAYMFLNGDIEGEELEGLSTIGFIRDYSLSELIQLFAKDMHQAEVIASQYRYIAKHNYTEYATFDGKQVKATDFYTPQSKNKCRVIEVWRKEAKEALRCHDILNAETFVCDVEDRELIDMENVRRVEELVSLGGEASDAALIEYEWFIDRYWYVRYLTPNGYSVFESRTPYDHNSSPYVVMAYPMMNGEVHSPVEDVIDQQRYINRYITMMDFARNTGAKGALIFPKSAIPQGMTEDDICEKWACYDEVIFADLKPGVPLPQQISTSAVQASDIDMLNMQMKLIDEISGINGALTGRQPSSGTPSSLYAQEAQNANVNLLDFTNWFNSFVTKCDYKMMKVIQQYYKEPRYMNIAGTAFKEEAKWYDPYKIKNSEFDVSISQSPATPAYKMLIEDTLIQMLQGQMIDLKQYLENSSMPYADKLLESVKMKEEELAQQQQAMQQQMQEQGIPPEAAPMV